MADGDETDENPLRAAAEQKRLKNAAERAMDQAKKAPIAAVAGAAVGSAAVVAAMLYFNRDRPKKKGAD